jgi:hypothetical protein
MKSPNGDAVANSGLLLTCPMKSALALLIQARDAAAKLNEDVWTFAVQIDVLKEAGINHNDLRLLMCAGFVEHQSERTRIGSERRSFCRPRAHRFGASSCFALTDAGLAAACELLSHDAHTWNRRHVASSFPRVEVVPSWDGERRELRMGDALVKRFRQPAKNQEAILSAFEEDGWPPRIDNPLAGDGDIDGQDRMHDAVKKLNHQTNYLLHFLCDGNGLGVFWEHISIEH